jgi:diguanylate cyclase (GGDEF)-like protein/PAS domain S-box-containing protein
MRLLSPAARTSVALLSVTLCSTLLADLVFGVLRDDVEVARHARKAIVENLAIQLAVPIQKGDRDTIKRTLLAMTARDGEIVSIGVRRASGDIYSQSGDHSRQWESGEVSTANHIAATIYAGKALWGAVEVSFRPVMPSTSLDWATRPLVEILLVLTIGGFSIYFWHIHRALEQFDPTRTIPQRVRKALDTLSEGVMALDTAGRIVLANGAFRALHGDRGNLSGRRASEIPWLKEALQRPADDHPWNVAVRTGSTVAGELLEIAHGRDEPRKVKLTASPIADARGTVRGCLVSITDITELDRKNAALEQALIELEASRRRVAMQNEDLRQLANIDPLTGCMNRRAFFETAESLAASARAQGMPLACLMTDIDKFKSFNDTYGHAVGDQVLQQVARVLNAALRPTDLLCRYGGEEFCILLPSLDATQATQVAERIRARVEAQAGPGIRSIPDLRITASFGVSGIEFGAASVAALMDQADQALYAAKEAGRNRVIRYDGDRRGRRQAATN